MTSSIIDEASNNVLDYNFLASFDHDEPDILDEFLDQRVYDSIGNTTPSGNGQVKTETNELSEFYTDNNNYNNGNFNKPSSNSISPQNDYLYLDPSFSVKGEDSGFPTNNNSLNVDENKINTDKSLSDHEMIRDELSKLKFGNHSMNPCPTSIDVADPSYLDFSPQTIENLPYQLQISNIPKYSRVETQIKLKLTLSPGPSNALLYIPQDLISKNKFCLNQPLDSLSPKLKENLLHLDAYVLTSDLKKSCNICSRCIKREQKRASRIKAGIDSDRQEDTPVGGSGVVKNNPNSWADDKMLKKAIIFNCKEIMSFPPPTGLSTDSSKSLELSARIICYCRHHKEADGFKLLFVVKNNNNEVVAKHISSPIIIMDRKKNTSSKSENMNIDGSVTNSIVSSSTNLKGLNDMEKSKANSIVSNSDAENISPRGFVNNITHSEVSTPGRHHTIPKQGQSTEQNQLDEELLLLNHPLSPNSIDESASEPQINTDATNDEGRNLKRKKLSVDDSYNTSSNPMFNGSVSGFSPMSNSDTNTSTSHNFSMMKPQSYDASSNQQFGTSLPQQVHPAPQTTFPSIQRIIPAQGPIRGGIEVTLLGFNFRPGLSVKFGANQALATHCWSETTIVTYLPPASQPGQVLVSFENHDTMMSGGPSQLQIFTYTDDTDRQLIELALQIVGLKMNGKLEDAKNIAKRIVGTDNNNTTNNNNNNNSMNTGTAMQHDSLKQANEWFDNAHKAAEQLSKSDLSTEDILINFLSLVDLPNCPIIIPNWQLCNNSGQTLLHLSTLKKYSNLAKFLIAHGCKIDLQDNQGVTPLFLASMCGHRDLIKIFIDCKSNWNLKLSNDKYLKDYCDLNVLDIFNTLEQENDSEDIEPVADFKDDKLSKSISLDSLNSMLTMSYGRHVSKMVIEGSVKPEKNSHEKLMDRKALNAPVHSSSYEESNYSSEFADSEFESNDDDLDETDDYDEDYDDDSDSVRSLDREIDDAYATTPVSSSSTILNDVEDTDDSTSTLRQQGLWQKVKNVFNQDESDSLPSYDDLFPFGQSSAGSKPKSEVERSLNEAASIPPSSKMANSSLAGESEDTGSASDSSEDMVVSFINHPRKTVENDKMLLFFWFPVLIAIAACFFLVSVMGYKFELIESAKVYVRYTIGNMMVGNERIGRLFNTSNAGAVAVTR